MGRKRRRFVREEVYFVTCRTARGLPFVPNSIIEYLLNGIIARTQELYPGVTICHYTVMGNHYHFIVVLEGSAEQMKLFFGYLNGEIASLFNRLQGTAHRKFWTKRYTAKPILSAQDSLDKIIYTYLNPVKANLVDRAQHWEGADSLQQFLDKIPRYYKWISSSLVERLPRGPFSEALGKRCWALIEESSRGERELKLQPFAWKRCFKGSRFWSDEKIRNLILGGISDGEKKYRAERGEKNKRVVGIRILRNQSIYKKYISKTYGRDSLCISRCKEEIRRYKTIYRTFCEECQRVYQQWKTRNFSFRYPPGAFIPWFPPTASIFEPT